MQAQRQGSDQEVARLQAQAFEAINDSVRSASTDTLPLVAQLVPLMLTKLGATMQSPITSVDEHERQSELQVRPRPPYPCIRNVVMQVPTRAELEGLHFVLDARLGVTANCLAHCPCSSMA